MKLLSSWLVGLGLFNLALCGTGSSTSKVTIDKVIAYRQPIDPNHKGFVVNDFGLMDTGSLCNSCENFFVAEDCIAANGKKINQVCDQAYRKGHGDDADCRSGDHTFKCSSKIVPGKPMICHGCVV
ncbi:hypothetical protein PGT21_029588 [Puccinia graminis f. sp. tritici]|uniref:Uncharacterized protein n=1 Tax=Puccinia graminis f. sp. tritici TaxID=56615 RepID=A0A5B0MGU4_PUCGR|nr:hypothetical protein PGTUg99_026996 [Puccinia graminis f. sp. tritici]KAA1091255.1 hypothetical protein PGT21_029588 [Puccinia graminis f. sp. tritici]